MKEGERQEHDGSKLKETAGKSLHGHSVILRIPKEIIEIAKIIEAVVRSKQKGVVRVR